MPIVETSVTFEVRSFVRVLVLTHESVQGAVTGGVWERVSVTTGEWSLFDLAPYAEQHSDPGQGITVGTGPGVNQVGLGG